MALRVSKSRRRRSRKISTRRKLARRGLVAALIVGFVGAVIATIHFTPPSMDEALQYHTLACSSHPISTAHVFREPCGGEFDLKVFGHWLPLRSYHYVGAISGLIYAPFYALFPFYPSGRWLGVLYLLLVVWGISKLARAPIVLCLGVAGLFLPLLLQIFCDTGPVGLQLVALVWIPLMLRTTVVREREAFLGWTLMTGLATFCAIEAKPFFLLMLPPLIAVGGALAFLALPKEWTARERAWTTVVKLLPTLALAAVLCSILFTAQTRDGRSYWMTLISLSKRFALTDIDGQATHLKLFFDGYLVDFTGFAHRMYDRSGWGAGFATVAYWTTTFVLFGHALARSRAARGWLRFGIFLGATIVAVLVMNTNVHVAAGHHFILLFPFFLVAIVLALRMVGGWKARWAYCGVLAVLQIATLVTLVRREPLPHANWERLELFAALDRIPDSESLIVVHIDWGTYYLQSLYSPAEQLVLYLQPVNVAGLADIKALSVQLKRRIAFVARTANETGVNRLLSQLPGIRLAYPSKEWQLWIADPVKSSERVKWAVHPLSTR